MSLCEQQTAATGKFDRALHVPEHDGAAPGLPRVMEPTSPQAQIPSAHGFPRRLTEPWVRAFLYGERGSASRAARFRPWRRQADRRALRRPALSRSYAFEQRSECHGGL